MNAIEQRPLTPWRTSTGVIVGGAYLRPQPQPSADDEAVQAALLDKRPGFCVEHAGHRVVLAISIVGLCAVVALLAVGALG